MEYAYVTVALNGDIRNTVRKRVSAVEAAILRELHGANAIKDIEKTETVKTNVRDELARLSGVYKIKDLGASDAAYALATKATFDALSSDKPGTFRECGFTPAYFKSESQALPVADATASAPVTEPENTDAPVVSGTEAPEASAEKASAKK